MNPSLVKQIETNIEIIRSERLVVRSSGDEDGKDESRAGLFESHTNVSREEVGTKILKTVASYFTPVAIETIKKSGKTLSNITLGIGIQEYIFDKGRSFGGTLFTYPDRIIMHVASSPEDVVSATAEASIRITLSRNGNSADTQYSGNIASLSFSPNEINEICPELVKIGAKIEATFGDYQDIEWVYSKDRGLFIVQARPL